MPKLIFAALCILILNLYGCAASPTPSAAPVPTALPSPGTATTIPATSVPATALPAATAVPTKPAASTIAATATPTLTPTVPHPQVFDLKADAPVLAHGKPPVFPYAYIDPGAVVSHDGKFYMFFNGINGWPAPVGVGLATSDDGMTWTRQGNDPVFKTDKIPYVGFTLFASSAIVQGDGTWVLYFYSLDETNFEKGGIGRATAKSPQGPWTADPALVLKPGDAGAWDSYQVSNPSVLKTTDGYVMYFAGGDKKFGQREIGMATSTDGVIWKKYRDPAANGAAYADSSPIFQVNTAGAWDDTRIFDVNVVHDDTGWTMAYLADKIQFKNVGVGIATSNDGVHWTRQYDAPVIVPTDIKNAGAFYLSNLVYNNSTYYLYFDVGRGRTGTDVFMATHHGALERN